MKKSCVVRNCSTEKDSDSELNFYPFPKEGNLKKQWLEAIGMFEEQLNKRSKICAKHFKKTDYDVKKFNCSVGGKAVPDADKKSCELAILKPEAVPSINLPQKSTFKIKISKKDNNSKEIRVEEVKVKEEKDKDHRKDKAKQEMPAPRKPSIEPRRGSRTRMRKRRSSDLLDSSDSDEEVKIKRPAPPPEVIPPRARTQARRAASKEALKQMQLLLGDDDDAVEIPDDDVLTKVEPTPPPPPRPKKTYKLSHRKSSDGNDRDVIVLKSITNRDAENTLELMCWVEELEEVQKNWISTIQKEEKELQEKLDTLIGLNNSNVVHKSDLSTIIEVTEQVQSAVKASQVPLQPIILNNNLGTGQQNYQLVMDPRLGLIVAGPAVSPGSVPAASSPAQQVFTGKVQVAQNLQQPATPTASAIMSRGMRTRRGGSKNVSSAIPPAQPPKPIAQPPKPISQPPKPTPQPKPTPPPKTNPPPRNVPPLRNVPPPRSAPPPRAAAAPSRAAAAAQQRNAMATQQQKSTTTVVKTPVGKKPTITVTPVATPPPTRSTRLSRDLQPVPTPTAANVRPSENNVEGGLSAGTTPATGKKVVVDLTSNDDGGRGAPDSREISFNKLQGKTYPSLVVVARPHLRAQEASVDRPKLDAKVKAVLMHAPTRFTEWLIQQGLVRSEQKCSSHLNMKLKLGMYSDVSKFPYSGGYVWISECCPPRFVSVFSGSLFEGSPHPPMVILKLLYHWACQTNIQNVTQWVKVDNLFVKGMFTWLRSTCSVALHTHLRQLGGPGVKVEVGVISLGTTSQDGNQRQVKVEVLGILETSTKLIRLRAVEPQTEGDRNYKKRFTKILEPIHQWVHPQSILVADLTVDKQTLHNMGFSTVIQSTAMDSDLNKQIMEYLRRIVPRMFQNTLSLLSRQIIQQFLDELVWREWFGTSPLQAFDNIVLHLAEQTRYDSGHTLLVRLNKVAQNPFKNWGIPQANNTGKTPDSIPTPQPVQTPVSQQSQKKPISRSRKSNAADTAPKAIQNVPVEVRPPKSTSPDVPEQMVPLENYYYGTIDTYSKTPMITLNIKCPFCKSLFDNNIQLMNHLFKHAHNVSQDAQLCRYCLSSVPTAADLLKHIASSHPGETKFDNGFICMICETRYMNPFVLGKHMSKEHCPSELPYQCGTCSYRCSNHKQAIDHFYRTHDNGPTIQCPFCLKSTTVFSSSRNITQNMNYFIQHLQKHQRKQLAKRCGKCNLWFVQKDVLRDHQTRMHVSQRGKTGMIAWSAPRNGVMVPKSKMDKYPCDAEVINFSTLTLNISKNLTCKECNNDMDTPKHFPSFESCQNPNCQYSTCCTNAMQVHNAKCNKLSNPVASDPLPFEMFCVCGYSDKDGNQMARHLAICERKSAYPSKVKAKAATVTHSMLDVLGLVRKPEESTSTAIKNIPTPEEKDVMLAKSSSGGSDTKGPKRKLLDDTKKTHKKRKISEKEDIKDDTQTESKKVVEKIMAGPVAVEKSKDVDLKSTKSEKRPVRIKKDIVTPEIDENTEENSVIDNLTNINESCDDKKDESEKEIGETSKSKKKNARRVQRVLDSEMSKKLDKGSDVAEEEVTNEQNTQENVVVDAKFSEETNKGSNVAKDVTSKKNTLEDEVVDSEMSEEIDKESKVAEESEITEEINKESKFAEAIATEKNNCDVEVADSEIAEIDKGSQVTEEEVASEKNNQDSDMADSEMTEEIDKGSKVSDEENTNYCRGKSKFHEPAETSETEADQNNEVNDDASKEDNCKLENDETEIDDLPRKDEDNNDTSEDPEDIQEITNTEKVPEQIQETANTEEIQEKASTQKLIEEIQETTDTEEIAEEIQEKPDTESENITIRRESQPEDNSNSPLDNYESNRELEKNDDIAKEPESEITNNASLENHVNDFEGKDMEIGENALEKTNSVEPEITSDDIQNLLSDVVGDKSSDVNFDNVHHMEGTTTTETDITSYSKEQDNQNIKDIEDISMGSTSDCLYLPQIANDVVESENIPMETE